jgi:hypothetical protein
VVTGVEERTRRRGGGIYFLAAISFWSSLASNYVGVICHIIGGDEGIDGGLEGDDSGSR